SPNGVFVRNSPALSAVVPTAMHTCHSLQKHRKKDDVHADERRPEMHFAPELAHLSTRRLREPIINTCEKSEDGARRNDVMEMRDDEKGIEQKKVGRIKRQRNAGQPADSKHRQERDGEKHRDVEAD